MGDTAPDNVTQVLMIHRSAGSSAQELLLESSTAQHKPAMVCISLNTTRSQRTDRKPKWWGSRSTEGNPHHILVAPSQRKLFIERVRQKVRLTAFALSSKSEKQELTLPRTSPRLLGLHAPRDETVSLPSGIPNNLPKGWCCCCRPLKAWWQKLQLSWLDCTSRCCFYQKRQYNCHNYGSHCFR